ncbi:MAG: YraN family protein [bacterium]|nr:YraN family protein [bacterium]
MTSTKTIGDLGEELAVEHLVKSGCKIIARNYRQKFGEIDIVAKAKDGLLLFIEVKTLLTGGGAALKPEDNMTSAKVKKFKKIAEFYALKYPEQVGERGWRADVAAVQLFPEYLTELGNNFLINYYENIF